MKRNALLTLSILTLPLFCFADVSQGKNLYTDANCQQCHQFAENFNRYKHKIKSLEQLTTRVRGCAKHFKVNWNDKEVEKVTNYLNTIQYKFK